MKVLTKFIVKNKELITFIIIILISAALRFYRIDEYMTFLGDEGRDALVIKGILVGHHVPLLGPPTSVGDMYNGPLYYYMMAVPMAIFWLNPIAAAGMVALIGTISVGLIYYLAKQWFGFLPAIISSILYSLSPVNIIYSRSSWNPNPAPFFSLLIILGLFQAHQTKNYLWLILVGVSFAFVVQMHLLSLILIPMIGVLWLIEWSRSFIRKEKLKTFYKGTLFGLFSFLFLMSPMAVFDLHHGFMNSKAFYAFFFGDRASTVNLNIFNSIAKVLPIYQFNLIDRYISGPEIYIKLVVSILILIPVFYCLYQLIWRRKFIWSFFAISLWLFVGVLGLSLYKQTIYDHYSTFLNPAPFLLIGGLIFLISKLKIKNLKMASYIVSIILFLFLIKVNLDRSPLIPPPNDQLQKTQDISRFIINLAGNKPFNFALLSEHNYDAAYQFYLDQYNHKPLIVPDDRTDQLLIVCEDAVCAPINNPKYEIAAFGWSKIETKYEYEGVKIFKLVPNPGGKS